MTLDKMDTTSEWLKEHKDRQGQGYSIWSMTTHEASARVAVTIGPEILIYHSQTGQYIQSLKGHKDTVQCVDWAKDGHILVSGGTDKHVILWNQDLKAMLKYSHRDPVQLVRVGPVHGRVVSICSSELILWTPNVKGLQKQNLSSRVISSVWSPDGNWLCIGHYDGTITIKNKDLEETCRIVKGNAPIWSLAWNPSYLDDSDISSNFAAVNIKRSSSSATHKDKINVTAIATPAFAAADGNRILSFYSVDGTLVGKEKRLKCSPPFIMDIFSCHSPENQQDNQHHYLAIASEDGHIEFWTWQAARVWQYELKNVKNHKISSIKLISDRYFLLTTKTGELAYHQLENRSMITQCKNRVAYRDGWSDVVVYNTTTLQRARIRCRDFIKSISLYKTHMAIGLVDRVLVYACADVDDMHYRIKNKINVPDSYSVCKMLSHHVLICDGSVVMEKTSNGETICEWVLSHDDASVIVKQETLQVIGGPVNRELVVLGLSNGHIIKLQMASPLIIPVIQLPAPTIHLSLSSDKRRLSILDSFSHLTVLNCLTHKTIPSISEQHVSQVLWHEHHPKLMAIVKEGRLNIRMDEYNTETIVPSGDLAHFSQNTLMMFHNSQLSPLCLSFSSLFQQVASSSEHINEAFALGRLSNTKADWQQFGELLLQQRNFDEAKRAFQMEKNYLWIEAVKSFEQYQGDEQILKAMITLFTGDFDKAIQGLIKSNNIKQAIDVLVDMQRFDEASKLALQFRIQGDDIMLKRADVLLEMQDYESSALLYAQCGQLMKAFEILSASKMTETICKLTESMDPHKDAMVLQKCAHYLSLESEHDPQIKAILIRIYRKINDKARVIQMLIKEEKWQDALDIASDSKDLLQLIAAPYTQALLRQDRFEEAKELILKSGDFSFCVSFLKSIIDAALIEHRYREAAYYSWTLASEFQKQLKRSQNTTSSHLSAGFILSAEEKLSYNKSCQELKQLIPIYRAYDGIYQYVFEPFTEYAHQTLLQMAKYLFGCQSEPYFPRCVRMDAVVYAATRICIEKRYWNAVKVLHEKEYLFPKEWQDDVDAWIMMSSCWGAKNDATLTNMSKEEAEEFHSVCFGCGKSSLNINDIWSTKCLSCKEPQHISYLSFTALPVVKCVLDSSKKHEQNVEITHTFDRSLLPYSTEYKPIQLSQQQIDLIGVEQLIQVEQSAMSSPIYYKTVDQSETIVKCFNCQSIFFDEEFEFALLSNGHCPICKQKDIA